jgi:hypothetical protein
MGHPVCVCDIHCRESCQLDLTTGSYLEETPCGSHFFGCNINRDASMTMTELAAQNPKQSYFLNLTGKKVTWGKLAHISAPCVHGIIGFSFFTFRDTFQRLTEWPRKCLAMLGKYASSPSHPCRCSLCLPRLPPQS